MAYSSTDIIAWASFNAMFVMLERLVERGALFKSDVQAIEVSITGILENGPDGVSNVPTEMSGRLGAVFLPLLAEIYARDPDDAFRA